VFEFILDDRTFVIRDEKTPGAASFRRLADLASVQHNCENGGKKETCACAESATNCWQKRRPFSLRPFEKVT